MERIEPKNSYFQYQKRRRKENQIHKNFSLFFFFPLKKWRLPSFPYIQRYVKNKKQQSFTRKHEHKSFFSFWANFLLYHNSLSIDESVTLLINVKQWKKWWGRKLSQMWQPQQRKKTQKVETKTMASQTETILKRNPSTNQRCKLNFLFHLSPDEKFLNFLLPPDDDDDDDDLFPPPMPASSPPAGIFPLPPLLPFLLSLLNRNGKFDFFSIISLSFYFVVKNYGGFLSFVFLVKEEEEELEWENL